MITALEEIDKNRRETGADETKTVCVSPGDVDLCDVAEFHARRGRIRRGRGRGRRWPGTWRQRYRGKWISLFTTLGHELTELPRKTRKSDMKKKLLVFAGHIERMS